MSLSRHFYALDEVHSALQYSSTRNDRAETLFWCNELLRSGYVSETISTLLESWLWNKGPFCLSWFHNSFSTLGGEECSEDDVLLSAYQLSCVSYLKRDHSLWSILALHAMNVPCDRVGPKTIPHPFTDEREIYLVRAMVQGRAYCAWCIVQQMDWDRVQAILTWYSSCHAFKTEFQTCLSYFEEYEKLLGYRTPEYDTVFRCLSIIVICLSPLQQEDSFRPLPSCLDATSQSQINHWNSLLGTKARVYSIPPSALYGRTLRGRMRWAQSTVSQLNDIEPSMIGCPFWEEAISEYGTIESTILWNSDDDREAFYQRYFPDDIPDEWTKSEKNKSHGEGILGPKESLTMVKYARSYLSKWSRFAWNSHPLIMKLLEGKEGTHPTSILLGNSLVEVHMIPVKRRLLV
jgi:hypothetical protein